jgi:hypothetical protein
VLVDFFVIPFISKVDLLGVFLPDCFVLGGCGYWVLGTVGVA